MDYLNPRRTLSTYAINGKFFRSISSALLLYFGSKCMPQFLTYFIVPRPFSNFLPRPLSRYEGYKGRGEANFVQVRTTTSEFRGLPLSPIQGAQVTCPLCYLSQFRNIESKSKYVTILLLLPVVQNIDSIFCHNLLGGGG